MTINWLETQVTAVNGQTRGQERMSSIRGVGRNTVTLPAEAPHRHTPSRTFFRFPACIPARLVECIPASCVPCSSVGVSPLTENPHLRSGWGFLFDKQEQGVPVAAWKQNGRCIGGRNSWLGTGCSVSRRTALACCAGGGDGLWLPPQTRQRRLTPACSRVMSLRWCYHHQRHCKMVCPTPS